MLGEEWCSLPRTIVMSICALTCLLKLATLQKAVCMHQHTHAHTHALHSRGGV
jgi:hypothetical protein